MTISLKTRIRPDHIPTFVQFADQGQRSIAERYPHTTLTEVRQLYPQRYWRDQWVKDVARLCKAGYVPSKHIWRTLTESERAFVVESDVSGGVQRRLLDANLYIYDEVARMNGVKP